MDDVERGGNPARLPLPRHSNEDRPDAEALPREREVPATDLPIVLIPGRGVPGVFCVGDVRSGSVGRVATAAREGPAAAANATRPVTDRGGEGR
ncbi:hypothetical protein [Streptomyces sp. NRRL B-24484]|uniref:hypothetical protein n=1 Tax=Streptomyces sp. NRRL B-24484 TaxID=1463833 RepID=UPI0004C0B0BA|nr:hypothetical protein [Streptomyces sp. NRRL B-24484]